MENCVYHFQNNLTFMFLELFCAGSVINQRECAYLYDIEVMHVDLEYHSVCHISGAQN